MYKVIKHNYGNLIYGLYRREILLYSRSNSSVFDAIKFINEIPIFLQVAAKGQIQVCSKILFYKRTSLPTYLQAAKEYGLEFDKKDINDFSNIKKLYIEATSKSYNGKKTIRTNKIFKIARSIFYTSRYHMFTWVDVLSAIKKTNITFSKKVILIVFFTFHLVKHFLTLVVFWPLEKVSKSL